MVRSALEVKFGCREKFLGRFKRFGTKAGYNGRVETTVLIVEIKDAQGQLVADHLWFNYTKGFQSLELREGDIVEFEARVSDYLKGYVRDDEFEDERTVDYRLSYPSKISKVLSTEQSLVDAPQQVS